MLTPITSHPARPGKYTLPATRHQHVRFGKVADAAPTRPEKSNPPRQEDTPKTPPFLFRIQKVLVYSGAALVGAGMFTLAIGLGTTLPLALPVTLVGLGILALGLFAQARQKAASAKARTSAPHTPPSPLEPKQPASAKKQAPRADQPHPSQAEFPAPYVASPQASPPVLPQRPSPPPPSVLDKVHYSPIVPRPIRQRYGEPIERCSAEFDKDTKAFFKTLPAAIQDRIGQSDYTLYVWKRFPDLFIRRQGWSPWGICDSANRCIVIPEYVDAQRKNPDWKNIIVHEIGHQLSEQPGHNLALDPAFHERALREINSLPPQQTETLRRGLMYGRTQMKPDYLCGEVFAQMTSEHLGIQSVLLPPNFLKDQLPETYQRYKALVKTHYGL